MRLNKYLSSHGVCSRREADRLIDEGRVAVNGETAAIGLQVSEEDSVTVDGKPVRQTVEEIFLAVNKPRGVVVTTDRTWGDPVLEDIVSCRERVFAVGRLDKESEGLILMTNNGELAERIMHPRYEIQKTYNVTLKGHLTPETLHRMTTRGVCLDDGWQKFDKATLLTSTREYSTVRVTLHSGKNRIVRRMFAALGFTVIKLVRMKIGPISLGTIKSGSYRMLTNDEITTLKKEVAL